MEKGKVISIEDRIPKLKKIRKRKANRRLIILLSLFFILMGCVLYFLSPLSHVKTVEVSGNRYLTDEQIIKLSDLNNQQSIWKVDTAQTAAHIKENPEIKTAKIVPVFPNSLKITVTEYNKMAYLFKENHFYPILENGKILDGLESTEIPVFAPVLINFKEGAVLKQLLKELKKLPDDIQNSISEIHNSPTKTDPYHITMYMNDGFEVSATSLTLADKMVHYPAIVSQLDPQVKGVIDLEVGSYFKAYETPKQKPKVRE